MLFYAKIPSILVVIVSSIYKTSSVIASCIKYWLTSVMKIVPIIFEYYKICVNKMINLKSTVKIVKSNQDILIIKRNYIFKIILSVTNISW